MAQSFPYTYYACDCYDSNTSTAAKRASQLLADAEEEDHTFEPQNPRSNYSLYPLEHLLYCGDCQQIRCPRCIIEETLNWYCPNCLFEVPSSVVKSDGNRCTRNCFNCPICIAPLSVSSLGAADASSAAAGPFVLACHYCHWTTLETGIEFEKQSGIHGQLTRIANGGRPIPTQKERDRERERRKEAAARRRGSRANLQPSEESPLADGTGAGDAQSRDDIFSSLSACYKSQIEAQTPSNPFGPHDINFSSPSAYTRIMNLYSSSATKKQKRAKPTPIREASTTLEGLTIYDPADDSSIIDRIKRDGWNSTLSSTQRLAQVDPHIRYEEELRPIPTLLCTKRSKRCRSCRHILSKPESKITSTRYKIKLLALSHIPRLNVRALRSASNQHPLPPSQPAFNYAALKPQIPTHFLLQLTNPLFDSIRVTLATPSTTPGRISSRVTILCPQFEVGANTDVWDDALSSSSATLTNPRNAADGQVEAGKIWDRGRNWTSVIIEVVPGQVPRGEDRIFIEDDDCLLEIPVFVRLEFETDVNNEERGLGDSRESKGEKEKREEAFWVVVGVGRITV